MSLRLEDLKKDAVLKGVIPSQNVRVVSADPIGPDAVTLTYRDAENKLGERMLFRSDEAVLDLVTEGRPWSFDGDGADFKLAAEAHRIHLAHLFDPLMAVHTSNLEPLPHQITAVYESMLPRTPLRFLLADDPGAGKTIMAGLFIKELQVRGDLARCLIIAPGALVEQWQDELEQKFGLDFELFSREVAEATRRGVNPFDVKPLLICRLDQISRAEDLQERLFSAQQWDLVVVDEAHKMSANWFGNELKKTKRYLLGEKLGGIARHLLLMTATPHSGIEENFQAFLALLDADRFYGKYRDAVHQVDVSDLMRRMVKEDLRKFDGTPLFPERRAYTATYKLSDLEAALYEAVTQYVREEMNRADKLDGKRRGTVGFALTILQRRLASSPEAIFKSIERRRKRLESRLEEEKLRQRGTQGLSDLGNVPGMTEQEVDDLLDEAPDSEIEQLEEQVVDEATAARTIAELETEIQHLRILEEQAKKVRYSNLDRKWEELSRILQDTPEMYGAEGRRRKLIALFDELKERMGHGEAACLALAVGRDWMVASDEKGRFRREAVSRIEGMFNVIHLETGFKIDLIIRKSRPFSRAEFARRLTAEMAGRPRWFASPEDVILSKLEWSKMGNSERQFLDALNVARVQGRSLDRAYLDHDSHRCGDVKRRNSPRRAGTSKENPRKREVDDNLALPRLITVSPMTIGATAIGYPALLSLPGR